MKETKIYLMKKEKTINIYCNKCGEKIENIESSGGEFVDFLEVDKLWGYFSAADGERHSFDICEKCYREFIETFKIQPKIDL